MTDKQRLVFFRPLPDIITLEELVRILILTVFQEPGREDGIYSTLPHELKRHFYLQERDE